jgi:hypothetical protein
MHRLWGKKFRKKPDRQGRQCIVCYKVFASSDKRKEACSEDCLNQLRTNLGAYQNRVDRTK